MALARSIRTSLHDLDVKLNSGSELECILRDFEWVGGFAGDVFDTIAGPAKLDVRRAGEVTWRVFRLRRIATALQGAVNVNGASDKAQCLRKRIDRLRSHDPQSLDALWELEVAGAMARTGCAVEMSETDVVLRHENEAMWGIECKHPRSKRGLRDSIRDGCKQLASRRICGVVVVNADAVLHRAHDAEKPIIFTADTPEDFFGGVGRRMNEQLDRLTLDMGRVLNEFTAGVVLVCASVGWCKEPSAVIHTVATRQVPNLDVSGAGGITAAVAALLR